MNAQNFLVDLLELQNDTRVEQLEAEIRELYYNNFERLLWVLYRLDVDEEKLNIALKQSTLPEEKIITELLLERCNKIIKTRKEFSNRTNNTDLWSFDLEEE